MVLRYETFVPSKPRTKCWQILSRDAIKSLFTMMSRTDILDDEQLTFRELETVCIFPLHVIALQFIFQSRDFVKIESSKCEQHRELHSTDLHVAEVVRYAVS